MGTVRKRQVSSEHWSQWVDGLHEALAEAKTCLASSAPVSREWLETLMRAFHVIKGYAQGLGLHGVQSAAHALESRVAGQLAPKAAALPAESQSALRRDLSEGVRKLDGVLARMHELQLAAAARREVRKATRLSTLFARIESAALGIALDLGRELRFEISVNQDFELTRETEAALEAALLHAVRNSLDHGAQGVAGTLKVALSGTRETDALVIECRDGGAGIDPARVREAARGRQARFDAEMGGLSDDEVLQLLFLPGLSLSQGASRLSGRGYGLDIVREAIESRLRGKARIESRPGQGTRLVLRVPLAAFVPVSRS